jgi:alanyl aminopeptidase
MSRAFHKGRAVIDSQLLRRIVCLSLMSAACGCAGSPSQASGPQHPSAALEAPPTGRLPSDVRPLSYTLELTVLPKQERFTGRTQIAVQLASARDLIWLHGKDLHVTSVKALVGKQVIAGSYHQVNDDGLAALRFEHALPAAQSVIEIEYDAAFNKQLQGLFRVDSGGEAYAFTQFEAISARNAFPSFDEPCWKTPFDIWLTVPTDNVAASNTKSIGEEVVGGKKRVHFAPTKPLPTYLVALAVGPLDVVEVPPLAPSIVRPQAIPLRGLCPKGKGALLAHALAEVAPTLVALENYFGIAYPYDKLDIVAVPDFGPGAMENAGLVTFRDWLLLIDPKAAGETQRRVSAFVIAHEFAHQWFGDLVTMEYWDDIWLNEAFATWMEYRIVAGLHPDYKSELELVDDMQDAMDGDSRVSARMIRQPITSTHDILNAFDSITYNKGGGVIGMFERYLGKDMFQSGVQIYLREHAFANARTEDLLAALSKSSGSDVTTPFMTFLTQVGVPLVEAELSCPADKPPELLLRQSRYLPLGSNGNKQQTWQIPVCARYETKGALHESCTLLTAASGALPLEGGACPSWLMPNADGAGYYRFTLPSADLAKLRGQGLAKLSARERYVLAKGLYAGFAAGSVTAKDWLGTIPALAADQERMVATEPLGFLRGLRDHWLAPASWPALYSFVKQVYGPAKNRLGFREQAGEVGDVKLLRAQVLTTIADLGNDKPTRTRLAGMGKQYLGLGGDSQLHPDAVPNDLADVAVRLLVEDGDAAMFDVVYQRFVNTQDATLRGRFLRALSSVRDARSPKALALVLDPALRVNEVMLPLREQLGHPSTRDAAYAWFEQNFDAIGKRLSPQALGSTPWLAASLCSEQAAERVQAFFATRVASLPGAPRSLEGAVETLHLCVALLQAQREGVEAFFKQRH